MRQMETVKVIKLTFYSSTCTRHVRNRTYANKLMPLLRLRIPYEIYYVTRRRFFYRANKKKEKDVSFGDNSIINFQSVLLAVAI